MYIQMQKSHLIYARKHDGFLGYAAVKIVFIGSAVMRGLLFGMLRLFRPSDLTRARLRLSRAALLYHLAGQEPSS
jgi:hypothetical protein